MTSLIERTLQPEGVHIEHERAPRAAGDEAQGGAEQEPGVEGRYEKELRFNFNGAPVARREPHHPGSQLGDIFPHRYGAEQRREHAPTLDEDKHGVNLALTELTLPGQGWRAEDRLQGRAARGETAPSGCRRALRATRPISRAPREGVIAALSLDPEMLQKALKGETVELSIGSVSLMTP
jgi:hypothetical protein